MVNFSFLLVIIANIIKKSCYIDRGFAMKILHASYLGFSEPMTKDETITFLTSGKRNIL